MVFISTDLSLSGKEIITTYRKRWNIEQGYKDLREHFGLGKEENRINHEPQTLGELFRDLECEFEALAISMQLFLQILTNIAEIENVVKENKDILTIIAVLSAYTKKELGFMCES